MKPASVFVALTGISLATMANGADLIQLPPGPIQSPLDSTAAQRLSAGSDAKTPTVKNFRPGWIDGLAAKGDPQVFTKGNSKDFSYIGMPIGGIGAGELYLSGDGKLWLWDIFNTRTWDGFGMEQGESYVEPHMPGRQDNFADVLDQGFVLRTTSDGKTDTRTIDKEGFSDVKFRGQYPVGYVDYSDPGCPVRVALEAFSPFVPGSIADSSYPATILNYTLTNTSSHPVDCVVGGWVENGDAWKTRHESKVQLQNDIVKTAAYTALNCSGKAADGVQPPKAPLWARDRSRSVPYPVPSGRRPGSRATITSIPT
jgi:hypothetical protein